MNVVKCKSISMFPEHNHYYQSFSFVFCVIVLNGLGGGGGGGGGGLPNELVLTQHKDYMH